MQITDTQQMMLMLSMRLFLPVCLCVLVGASPQPTNISKSKTVTLTKVKMLIEKITPPPSKYVSVEKSFAIHIKWPDGYFDCVQSQCDNKYKLRYREKNPAMTPKWIVLPVILSSGGVQVWNLRADATWEFQVIEVDPTSILEARDVHLVDDDLVDRERDVGLSPALRSHRSWVTEETVLLAGWALFTGLTAALDWIPDTAPQGCSKYKRAHKLPC